MPTRRIAPDARVRAQREYAPGRRPWVLTRAGYAGIQRYAATWTGDNRTSWKTLRYNIPMGLGLGLSGVANVGHDVGGFAGTTYNGQTAGTGSGFALASGRIAGENAANYVLSKSIKR